MCMSAISNLSDVDDLAKLQVHIMVLLTLNRKLFTFFRSQSIDGLHW